MPPKAKKPKPFLKIREVMLGDSSTVAMEQTLSPLGDETRSVTPEIFRKYSIENWDVPKLKRYVDMLKAFGYNSIQVYDTWESYLDAGWAEDPNGRWPKIGEDGYTCEPRDWPEKADAIGDYARSIGLRASIFVWGNAAFDYRANTCHWALCPNDPKELDVLVQHYEHQARHAPHFDHLITHWGDPGGCKRNGCTIETATRLHMDILGRFRRFNPKIESTFSLWMLNDARFGKWSGYKSPETVAAGGILADDVMLSLHAEHNKFDEKELREVARTHRRVGMWTWYLVNNEIIPSCFVRTKALKEFFDALPADAHDLIAWESIDSNNHVLNFPALYVCAKLMLDRRADPRAAQREFLAGALGKENVEAADRALDAIETLRPMWPYKYGDEALDVNLAREAEKAARSVKIAPDFKTAFPMPVTPAEFAEEIVAQTEVMRQFAEFSVATAGMEKKAKPGSEAKFEAAIAKLPKVPKPTSFMTNLEYCRFLARIESLRKGWSSGPSPFAPTM